MYWWQITKYNPKYRMEDGSYTKDEWTAYSDIGRLYENKKVTYAEYIKNENAYAAAVLLFMDCLGLTNLHVFNLEKHKPYGDYKTYSEFMISIYKDIKDKQLLNKKQIDAVVRLALREDLWCKLKSEDLEIHFGYDYYMYIGSKDICEEVFSKIKKMGLFVEMLNDSPHNID